MSDCMCESIELTDGSKLNIKVNFATLYYIKKSGLEKFMKKKKTTEDDDMEMAARLIYVILRSNGRDVTMDEAMMLVPIDDEVITQVYNDFKDKLEKYKKKENSRKQMKAQMR